MAANAIYGLLLAGGQSRRLGQDKALLERDGQSQLAYLTTLLKNHVDRVFVSTRSEQSDDEARGQYQQIVDRYDNIGPAAGILTALEQYPEVDWLVLACDLPNIDDETIRVLLQQRSNEHPFTAYISSHDGLPEPLCAVYRADSADIVRSFIETGMVCPRKMLIRSDTYLLRQSNPQSLDNVNTPDDLRNSVLHASS